MEFGKLVKPSRKELFVHSIAASILSNKIEAGTQLPTERELSQQMKLSRPIISEGLAELEKIGLVEVRPRQGIFVADFQKNGSLETLAAIVKSGFLPSDKKNSMIDLCISQEMSTCRTVIDSVTDSKIESFERQFTLMGHSL